MGTPDDDFHQWQACQDLGGLLVPTHIQRNFKPEATILDVGAGWDKYRRLLPGYTMDACEVWLPNVKDLITAGYREVFNKDIVNLRYDWYDAIIFGDVLEHLSRDDAKRVLDYAFSRCDQFYIVVPYMYKQGAVDGNPFEEHLQPDLTDDVVRSSFPVRLLARDETKGVYTK